MKTVNIIEYKNICSNDAMATEFVNEIPADDVAVLFIGGSGIFEKHTASKLAGNVAREILGDITGVSNYAVVYDQEIKENPKKYVKQRMVQFDKHKKNFLDRSDPEHFIYLSLNNLEYVFNKRIAPYLKKEGTFGAKNLRFAIDGDMEQVLCVLNYNIKELATEMGWTNTELNAVYKTVSEKSASYSKMFDPKYIDDLFDKVLLRRICNNNGNRLPTDVAKRRIRKLNIISHCHGAYVAMILSQRLVNKMQELGYSVKDIDIIQSQLLIVSLAPSCPLGVTKTRTISFMSAYDSMVERPDNWVSDYLTEKRSSDIKKLRNNQTKKLWGLKMGFLGGRNGDVFYVKNRFHPEEKENGLGISWNEHNNSHFFHEKFTSDGELLATFARNIIRSGIQNSLTQDSLNGQPLPPIDELVLDGKNDKKLSAKFSSLKRNGKNFIKSVCAYATLRIKEKMRKKQQLSTDVSNGKV